MHRKVWASPRKCDSGSGISQFQKSKPVMELSWSLERETFRIHATRYCSQGRRPLAVTRSGLCHRNVNAKTRQPQ